MFWSTEIASFFYSSFLFSSRVHGKDLVLGEFCFASAWRIELVGWYYLLMLFFIWVVLKNHLWNKVLPSIDHTVMIILCFLRFVHWFSHQVFYRDFIHSSIRFSIESTQPECTKQLLRDQLIYSRTLLSEPNRSLEHPVVQLGAV